MRENISAMMDGELDSGQAGRLIEQAGRDDEAREAWAAYHFIGDVLRGGGSPQTGIQTRICLRLVDEPTVLAPRARGSIFAPGRNMRVGMAVAASVATISVVAWMARQDAGSPAPLMAQTAPAQTVAQATVESVPVASIQPANVSEYLLAHEEFSPSAGSYRLTNANSIAPASGAAGR